MNTPAMFLCIISMVAAPLFTILASQNQKRNRGESFYSCVNSNTPGAGDIWLSFMATGHIWDDSPIMTDTLARTATNTDDAGSPRKWISNMRAFPDAGCMIGISDFVSVHASSRLLSYGFLPGYFSGGLKCTFPNNSEIRTHGFGLMLDYKYIVRESAPSLGGYIGFMPEGFFVKGSSIESRMLYEFDLLPILSYLPIRALANTGFRFPVTKRRELKQFLADIMIVYSGYGYDFYAGYSLESFFNFFSPITIQQENGKKFLLWFEENPMYLVLGGNIRYDNGITLSLSIPLLLSVNHGSRMRNEDLVELVHRVPNGRFMYEKDRMIRDPFDPWFVKWKIAGTLTIPFRFTMTGTEMMRNYLLLKNKKEQKTIDIDARIDAMESRKDAARKTSEDDERRLEAIKKRRATENR